MGRRPAQAANPVALQQAAPQALPQALPCSCLALVIWGAGRCCVCCMHRRSGASGAWIVRAPTLVCCPKPLNP